MFFFLFTFDLELFCWENKVQFFLLSLSARVFLFFSSLKFRTRVHLHNDDVVLSLEVKRVVSRDSWANLTSFCRQERLLPPSFPLSLPSASPQLCCLWHLSDTPGSSANSLYWHKTLLLFCWVHFLPVEWAEPAERGAVRSAGGNTYLGDSSFWQQQAAETAQASCEASPSGHDFTKSPDTN